ncbi:hypothetical protein ACLOJK_035769 [Asimina triloba]
MLQSPNIEEYNLKASTKFVGGYPGIQAAVTTEKQLAREMLRTTQLEWMSRRSFQMGWKSSVGALCSLFLFALAAEAQEKVFNVQDFGAVPDGNTDCTKAFLDAWTAACAWEGPTRYLIPGGGTFLLGPITFKGPCKAPELVYEVAGVVKAPGLDKFPSDGWIEFMYINGLVVTGRGTFDGQGDAAWACNTAGTCKHLPISLRFTFINNGSISQITSLNSKNFHMSLFGCNNLELTGLTITAPGDSPNTDGIHMATVNGIRISDSVIGTGDDCVSIGPTSNDVSVTNVVCAPGHGISIGSLGKGPNDKDVTGVHVQNCTIKDAMNGVRIKTWEDSIVMAVSNLTFQDIIMENVQNPIIIDQQYCPSRTCTPKAPSSVKISDVKFANIQGSSASKVAVNLLCSKSVPCQNVKLENINLEYKGEKPDGPAVASCTSVVGVSSGTQNPPSCI